MRPGSTIHWMRHLDGPCQQTGQGNHQRQKQRPEEQQIPNDNGALEKPAQSRKHKRQHHHQPLHASSKDGNACSACFSLKILPIPIPASTATASSPSVINQIIAAEGGVSGGLGGHEYTMHFAG